MLVQTPAPQKALAGSPAAANANHMLELRICISTHLFKLWAVFLPQTVNSGTLTPEAEQLRSRVRLESL